MKAIRSKTVRSVICSAKRTNGLRCKAQAIVGGTVCRVHGGSAPQVRNKARQRILEAADPAAARLVKIALNTVDERLAVAAIRDLLDRADIKPEAVAEEKPDGGQVLWEEFIQIHRRRVDVPGS